MDKKVLFKKIYREHIKQVKNLSVPHGKLIICFSGVPGSGKTYVAKILEERYSGVRIRNDDVREIVSKLEKTLDVDQVTYEYFGWFIENYDSENRLLILDSGIERRYQELFPLFEEKGYEIFIIRLNVPEEVYEQRIINKLGKLDQNYVDRIDDWKRQYREFGERVKSNIIIDNKKDNELNLESLFKKLDKLVN